jgi:beta-xylosidase
VKRASIVMLLLAVLAMSGVHAFASDGPSSPPPDPPAYSNPVMTGDFPDPTAMRVGPEYWAITTASSGQPSPPILRSPDLVNWSHAGYLLLDPPAWSSGRQLWAPSLERDGDRYLVYYSARRKYGRPCVTVAEASNPIGPYTDAGPLVCQENASIDPSVVRNANHRPFLVWKENGGTRPSSLWVQPLTRDLLRLTGERRRIMVGSRANWEGGLIEGPHIVRRQGWHYLFYSGGRCCAPSTCRYALGVARARSLYGPWRRYKHNPVLKSDKQWICPGHGSLLQTPSGHWWLLYHGYRASASDRRGREILLDLVRWSRDGWPVIEHGARPQTG